MSELRAIPLSDEATAANAGAADGEMGRLEAPPNWRDHYPAYPPGGTYPIDLETLTSSAEVLDMICRSP
jgi:hypothetical protein